MPEIEANGIQLHYEEAGSGVPLVLTHSLVLDGQMYEPAIALLAERYRVINLDLRGHGKSSKPHSETTLDEMTEDVYQAIQNLDLGPVLYAGLSLGGMLGMRLALRHRQTLRALVLLDTSAEQDPNAIQYEALAQAARASGPDEATATMILGILFSPAFLTDNPEAARQAKQKISENDGEGLFQATMAVIRRENILEQLRTLSLPTLVVVGDQDQSTPPSCAEAIHQAIPQSELMVVPGAGHISIAEQPTAVTQRMIRFFDAALVG